MSLGRVSSDWEGKQGCSSTLHLHAVARWGSEAVVGAEGGLYMQHAWAMLP